MLYDKTKNTIRERAKQLRYKKPIVQGINLEDIQEEVLEISSECDEVQWYCETDDELSLISELIGEEEQASEFRMMFSDLSCNCSEFLDDIRNEYIPECFNIFFVAMGAGRENGLFGWDSYESDYYGITNDKYIEQESAEKLKRMTKDQLIEAAGYCFRIYQSYIGLKYRYDCLKASMDIIREQNTGYLQVIKNINEVYEKACEENFYSWGEYTRKLTGFAENLPKEAWIA